MNNFKSPNQLFSTLNTIFYALMSGVLIFFLATHLGLQNGQIKPANPDLVLVFNYLLPFVCVLQAGLSIFIFSLRMQKIKEIDLLKDKLAYYFQSKLIQWALLEGAALFAIIVYFLTGAPMYALWWLLMIITMSFFRSSVANFTKYAALTKEETNELEGNKNF